MPLPLHRSQDRPRSHVSQKVTRGPVSAQQTAVSDTASYQRGAQGTQTYQPPRQEQKPYQPAQPAQRYSYPGNQQKEGEPQPLFQDTQSFKPAPMDPNAKRLDLKIKTARVEMEELPAQFIDEESLNGKKRVRRTERNKALYDDEDPKE